MLLGLLLGIGCTPDRRPDEDATWAATFPVASDGEAVTALATDDGGAVAALHLTSILEVGGGLLDVPDPGTRSNGAVVRLDEAGAAVWAVGYPLAAFLRGAWGEEAEGRHVAIDSASGDVWVGGSFWTDPDSWLAEGLDDHASLRGFLHRVDAAGEPGPVVHVGEQAAGAVGAIDVEGGTVAVTGWFADDVLAIGDATLANAGGDDGFVAAYGTDGVPRWAVGLHGEGGVDRGIEVIAHPSGAVTAAGSFAGALGVGGQTLQAGEQRDGWVARFDPDGTVAWAVPIGGDGDDRIDGLVVDDHDRTWVAGSFDGESLVAGDWVVDRGFVGGSVFLASLDQQGNVERLVVYGEDQQLLASDLALDDGRVLLTAVKTGGELRLDGVIVTEDAQGFVAALGPDGPVSATVGTYGQVRTTSRGLVLAGAYLGSGRTGTNDLPSVGEETPFVSRVVAPW